MIKMLKSQKGQTMVEYALILALIVTIAVVAALTPIGGLIATAFQNVVAGF